LSLRLTSEAADTLESLGVGLVVLGAAWGISRAAPSLRGPVIAASVGAGLVYGARRWSESPVYFGEFAQQLTGSGEVDELDVIEGESRVVA
jgi:hypothetical protein